VKKATPDFLAILEILAKHQVEFIVVGGVCAVLHGAPVATFDLDLVHSRAPANLDRLMVALKELDAHYRVPGRQDRTPDLTQLASSGHQLLMTDSGPLDLLGEIGSGRGYDQLLDQCLEVKVGPALRLRILKLEALIKSKEETARDKDKAVLAILRCTLEEKSKY
jgi:hypothetical protein